MTGDKVIYPAGDRIAWNVVADGDYVVLQLPDNNLELLFDPYTTCDLVSGLEAAAADILKSQHPAAGCTSLTADAETCTHGPHLAGSAPQFCDGCRDGAT